MVFICCVLLGITVFGGEFIKLNIWGIELFYICMLIVMVSYCNSLLRTNGKLYLKEYDLSLLFFCIYAVMRIFMSYLGITDFLISDDVYINIGYIPRQAYYIAFLPLAIFSAKSRQLIRLSAFMQAKRFPLFVGILCVSILYNRQLATGVTSVFVLSYLAVSEQKKTKADYFMFAAVMCLPIAEGGEMTNVLIRFVFLVVFIWGNKNKGILKLMSIGIWLCIGVCFFAPAIVSLLDGHVDPNMIWRANYWKDELVQLAKSYFCGIGYGTAYATTNFTGDLSQITHGPFAPTANYSVLDKLFVTGPHNSFVSIAFRLGLLGLGLFCSFLIKLNQQLFKQFEAVPLKEYLALSISLILISLNVGLESPYYMLFFVFSLCLVKSKCCAGDL